MTAGCDIPPEGWRCTSVAGHDGPCPTVPVKTFAGYLLEHTQGMHLAFEPECPACKIFGGRIPEPPAPDVRPFTGEELLFNAIKDTLIDKTGSPGTTSFRDGKVHMTLTEWDRLVRHIPEPGVLYVSHLSALQTARSDGQKTGYRAGYMDASAGKPFSPEGR